MVVNSKDCKVIGLQPDADAQVCKVVGIRLWLVKDSVMQERLGGYKIDFYKTNSLFLLRV